MKEYHQDEVVAKLLSLKEGFDDETDVCIVEELIFLMCNHWGSVDPSVVVDIMEENF